MKRKQTFTAAVIGATALLAPAVAAAGPIEDLQPGHWYEVPDSVLEDVEKKPEEYADFNGVSSESYDSYQRIMGVRAVVLNWCGAAFNSHEDQLVVFGGGHNGYGGNELYAFGLNTLEWERLTEPTVAPDRCVETNYDGTPTARHTYGGLAYIEAAGRMLQTGGAWDCDIGGGNLTEIWTFDFDDRSWEPRSPSGATITPYFEGKSVYDPVTERVYIHEHGWWEYDYTTNTLEEKTSFNNWDSLSMAIDVEARVIIEIGDGTALRFDLNADDRMGEPLTAAGSDAIAGAANPGLKYDYALQRIVAWTGGTDVYSLDLAGNAWETHPAAAENAVVPSEIEAAGGTYGRFAYSQTHNIYVLVNAATENVYLYRLSEGGGATPGGTDSGGTDSGGADSGGPSGTSGGADDSSGDAADGGGNENSGSESGPPPPGDGESGDQGGPATSTGPASAEDSDSGAGCSCRSGAGASWTWLGFLAVFVRGRRRRGTA